MPQNKDIIQKGDIIYLRSGKDWFAYNHTLRPIGSGAMGIVYRGWRIRDNLPVAVKQVVPRYAEIPGIRKRARLEASMLFGHPNLVEMLGFCEYSHDRGPIYVISVFVKGITLDTHISMHRMREKPDAEKRICETFFPVLDALDYLHSKNIIHMDVKPSNIMLENGYNIRLMDLGIANVDDVIEMTSPGVFGTPMYAAPEQFFVSGENRLEVDKTTDLYELGVTLYEMLTGTNPYSASTMDQIIIKHRTEVLPDAKGVSKRVLEVLRKATCKEKAGRYQSAFEFKQALQQALQSKPSIVEKIIEKLFG